MYNIQHCFICRPSDFTVSEDAGIEPRKVATTALAVRRSNHTARSHPQNSARSHPQSAKSHPPVPHVCVHCMIFTIPIRNAVFWRELSKVICSILYLEHPRQIYPGRGLNLGPPAPQAGILAKRSLNSFFISIRNLFKAYCCLFLKPLQYSNTICGTYLD
jgi:hypothetical protein